MAMHEKKENGDKEADHHGHNMYLGVRLINHRTLIEYTVERTKHGIWIWCLRMGVCSTPKNGLLERGNLDLAERSLKMLRGKSGSMFASISSIWGVKRIYKMNRT